MAPAASISTGSGTIRSFQWGSYFKWVELHVDFDRLWTWNFDADRFGTLVADGRGLETGDDRSSTARLLFAKPLRILDPSGDHVCLTRYEKFHTSVQSVRFRL